MKNLQITLPDGLRKEADQVFSEIGMDTSTAIRIYLRKVVQTRSIPFDLEAPRETVEMFPVDKETQTKMDAVASAWKKRKR
ncbi:MAG: type II toxin-antitoxin system RelB/DinJ family antitoxin [Verrucomicrobiota bacterium]